MGKAKHFSDHQDTPRCRQKTVRCCSLQNQDVKKDVVRFVGPPSSAKDFGMSASARESYKVYK